MRHGRHASRILDGAEVDECGRLCEIGRVSISGSQLSPPDTKAGRRHRFITAISSDALSAVRMPEQTASLGDLHRALLFQPIHVRLHVVELGRDCADLRNRKIQRRSVTGYDQTTKGSTGFTVSLS
jgi:hypothetical protein